MPVGGAGGPPHRGLASQRGNVVRGSILAPSALKHGLSEEEIPHANRNPVRVWDLGDGLTMIVGSNQAAIFLEVGDVDGDTAGPRWPRSGH
jgi:hypothetical protein